MEATGAAQETETGANGTASRWWHGCLTVLLVVCFGVQLVVLFLGGQDANSGEGAGLSLGTRLVRFFSYFTIQSNILTLVAAATLMMRPQRDGRGWRVLRLDALLGIVITGLVFDLLLANEVQLTGLGHALTLGFHYLSPWGALLGWLLFGPRPRIDWRTLGLAFIWPVLWIAYTFAHGAISGWYPYPFLDAGQLGVSVALRNTVLVVFVALVLALIFKALDRLPTIRR